jgi:hypothetical protein
MILGTDEVRGGWGVASTKSIYTVLKFESDSSTMARCMRAVRAGFCRAGAGGSEEVAKSEKSTRNSDSL